MVQSQTAQRNALNELGYKIFLDRYAQKDMTRSTLAVGDTVIVVVDSKTGQREIGKITALNLPKVTVELLDGETVERDLEHVDKPLETDPGQMMDRVAAGIAAIETTPELQQTWTERFRWLLDDWKFVPAGRILTAAGTDQLLTFYNCYVVASPRDSRGGIIETLRQMTEIMSRGGGVGINISSLRPRQAYVKGVNGRSSGAVSWGALYSFVTGLIEQGGCLTPDTLVFTKEGLLRLDEIVQHSEKGWREQTLTVMTDDGERVSRQVYNNGVADVLTVKTDMGLTITGTPNHKVKVMTAYGPEWRPLSELQTGDAILVKLNQHRGKFQTLKKPDYHHHNQDTVKLPSILDEELAFFLGYFMGDGFMTQKAGDWRLGVAVAHSSYLVEEMPKLMQRLFEGVHVRLEQKDNDASLIYLISNRAVKEFLMLNGFDKPKSADVAVPRLIRKSPPEVVGAFLRGLFEADGGLSHHYPSLSSTSKRLIDECATLLIGLGCPIKVEPFPYSADRYGNKPVWRLRVHSFRGLESWHAKIGCDSRSRFAACLDFKPDLMRETSYVLPHSDYWVEPVLEATALKPIDHRARGIRVKATDSPLRRKLLRYARGDRNLTLSAYTSLSQSHQEFARHAPPVNDTWFVFVDSVEAAGQAQTLDLEVDDNHTYLANGLVTHNSRRGALMLILNDWHPDVFDFINSKRKAGQITNANISVGVSDKLMEAVKADGEWTLRFPDTSEPGYDELWDGDLEKWMASGRKVIAYRTVKAREVWNAIIESAWASAEPGVFFRERYNKMSNSWYFAPIISTNPCVTGDTPVATEFGYTKARDLQVGMNIRTPAGLKSIEKVYNNGVQPIYRIKFSDGGSLEGTADHRLKVVRGKKYEWVAVADLREGDKVLVSANEAFGSRRRLPEEAINYIHKRKLEVPDFYDRTLGFLVGVVTGDGTLRQLPNGNSHSNQCKVAFGATETDWMQQIQSLLEEKLGIHTSVAYSSKDITLPNGVVALHQSVRLECYKLSSLLIKIGMTPNVKAPHKTISQEFMSLDREFLAGVLDGLFSTDGNVLMKRDNPMLRFSTSSYELAQQVRLLLLQFGIHGRVYTIKRNENLEYDGRSMYGTGIKYDVVIMNEGISRFYAEIGLSHPKKSARLKEIAENWHYIGGTWTASVLSVEDTGREEEVFDVYEPNTLTWVTNGYVSFDCGEQGLPAFGVCNLGAINLAKFYDETTNDVRWDDLEQTALYATRFLDNVIDSTPYFFEENRQQQLSERRVGLNNMGLAELMIRLGIRYGSDESVKFIDKLYAFLAQIVYETSVEIAREKGAFPKFDAKKFVQSGFMQSMPKVIRDKVKKYGIRNVTLLTQAPTGCVAPDTLISMDTGLRPIVDLGNPDGEQWQIMVRSLHTDEGLRKTSHFYINGYQATKTVTTQRGFSLTATPNHRIRVIDTNGEYVWRRMDELNMGDRLVLKKGTLGDGEVVHLSGVEQGNRALSDLPPVMTPELAELLGLYMGDGYTKARGGLHIVVCKKDHDLLQYIQDLMRKVWGENRQVSVEDRQGCWVANLTGYYIPCFFEINGCAKPRGNHGEGAEGAFIPTKVLRAGKACVTAFLRGLFEADGSVHRGTITLVSTSRKLIGQVQVALLGLGIVATVREMPKSHDSFGLRPKYELRILNRREGEKFAHEVGFISQRKHTLVADLGNIIDRGDSIAVPALCEEFYTQSKGLKNEVRQQIIGLVGNGALTQQFVKQTAAAYPVLQETRIAQLVAKDVFVDKVVAVEDGACHTYDLSVPDNHTYIANGFVSHNTTGTMVNTSTGIEPFFSWKYFRKSRLGIHEEQVSLVKEWFNQHPDAAELPDYFVTAMDLAPEEHVKVQAAIQRWVDSSISKTANLPHDYTVEQTRALYELMYDLGCKGGTVYRDGSRDEQVLTLKTDDDKKAAEPSANGKPVEQVVTPHRIYPRPRQLAGVTVSRKTPFGTAFITMNSDEHGNPFEVFITIGKAGSDLQADAEGLGRMISLQLRTTAPQNRKEMLKLIVDQLQGIGGSRAVGLGPSRVLSLPDAVGGALLEHYFPLNPEEQLKLPMINGGTHTESADHAEASANGVPMHGIISGADICPECGLATLVRAEGCEKCLSCGYSRC